MNRPFLFVAALIWVAITPLAQAEKPNVLFIAVDDLNDWVGYLGGHPQGLTPNIDALAARGMAFTNAHCTTPACNPSRAAIMSGMRPYANGVYANSNDWVKALKDITTLDKFFLGSGYEVRGGGKIYHGTKGNPGAYDEWWPRPGDAPTPHNKNGLKKSHFDWGPIECDDDGMGDHQLVNWAVDQLKADHEKPLLLFVGFVKPHLPFYAPEKYFEQFPLEQTQLPVVLENDLDDIPDAGVKMAKPEGDHADVIEAGEWKKAVQAYLATIAFVDHEVGRLIQGLEDSGKADNTVIVFWGDHGWHLGEKQHWRKFALWNDTTHVPFIMVAPGVTQPNSTCDAPVDLLGVYPTLVDLCGLNAPEHLQGANLRPLLENPLAEWTTPAISTHGMGNHMVQTKYQRYIRYANGEEEFYDHREDPNEWKNLAGLEETKAAREEMAKWMPTEEVPMVKGKEDLMKDEKQKKKKEQAKQKAQEKKK